MFNSLVLLTGKRKHLSVMILVLFVFITSMAFRMGVDDDFDIARKEVLLRKIGHELLLQSGDSTSRVLPVKKIAENEYQISFENELTFQSDSLLNTIRRLLSTDPLTGDYVVNIMNCGNGGIAFGYAISKNEKDNILACSGRLQPRACYVLNIAFKPMGMNYTVKDYLLVSLPLLAFVGFIFLRAVKPRKSLPKYMDAKTFTLGSVLFDAQERQLIINKRP